MKGRIVVLVYVLLIALSACSKKNEHKDQPAPDQMIVKTKTADGVFISDWKPALSSSHSATKKINTATRFEVPATRSLQQDVVLVFARNLWEDEAELKELGDDQPLQMPFKFLPYFEQPGHVEDWNYTIQENKIDVVLTVNGGEVAEPLDKKVEIQYLVIPSELVARKQQTKQTLRQMSYDEVLKTFNLDS